MAFSPIPEVPMGSDDQQFPPMLISILSGLKETCDKLGGVRGESGNVSAAVLRGDVSASAALGAQAMLYIKNPSVLGYEVSGVDVASLVSMQDLRADVQILAQDLAATRFILNYIIFKMSGGS